MARPEPSDKEIGGDRRPSNSRPSGNATAHHRRGTPATRALPTHSISSGAYTAT